jgi:hypothetical protein
VQVPLAFPEMLPHPQARVERNGGDLRRQLLVGTCVAVSA